MNSPVRDIESSEKVVEAVAHLPGLEDRHADHVTHQPRRPGHQRQHTTQPGKLKRVSINLHTAE